MPVFNGEKWIEDALESILAQSFTDFELVIADNASTDATDAICRAAAARDPRVHYHRNASNIGVDPNYDRVFALSTGKYFKWASCSDICLDGFFEQCVAVLDARPEVVLVYPKTLLFSSRTGAQEEYEDHLDIDLSRPSDRFIRFLNRVSLNNLMNGVIRASALRQTALNRPLPGSDISMVAELCFHGTFVEIPERLFLRRIDPQTTAILMNAASDDGLAAAYQTDPGGAWRLKLHLYRFVDTLRAPIAFGEKVRVWLYLVRRIAWLRHRVFRKLVRVVTSR